MPPIHVVVPVLDNFVLTYSLVEQVRIGGEATSINVYDHGSTDQTRSWLDAHSGLYWEDAVAETSLYALWNRGLRRAVEISGAACSVAILNNDIICGPQMLARLDRALWDIPDVWVACARDVDQDADNYCAYAFMVRGSVLDHLGPEPFDEGYRFYWGDVDFVERVRASGGRLAVVSDALVHHIGGGSQTLGSGNPQRQGDWRDRVAPHRQAAVEADSARFSQRWNQEVVLHG